MTLRLCDPHLQGADCCGEMVCVAGECDLTDVPEGCDYTLHAGLFADIDYASSMWGSKCLAAGTCVSLNLTSKEGEELGVSSLTWSDETGIQLFDADGCGGNSILVRN